MQPQILNHKLANNNAKIQHQKANSKKRSILNTNTSNKPSQSTQLSAGRQRKQQLQKNANMSDQMINDASQINSAYQQIP